MTWIIRRGRVVRSKKDQSQTSGRPKATPPAATYRPARRDHLNSRHGPEAGTSQNLHNSGIVIDDAYRRPPQLTTQARQGQATGRPHGPARPCADKRSKPISRSVRIEEEEKEEG
ncbi:hypothetical protein ABC337_09330 [Arthrobacter sp. 1P04PC]|uniref:hypothetical protein n=1 Tax=unclassified Arthrobacter TaxID=235627 RepID=UPI0039A1EC27